MASRLESLTRIWEGLQAFVELGGSVLVVIFFVTFIMWMLIIERLWYMRVVYPRHVGFQVKAWRRRTDRTSWYAQQIRRLQISRSTQRLESSLSIIKTLVALCPLLGLLGTVTGMIEVFDVMAMAGNGNPRAMAAGVSRATIPTMAGMVAALSGLYFSVRLGRLALAKIGELEDRLTRD